MKRKQFEPLVVHDFEETVFHLPVHSHTYYEIIYIYHGAGMHLLNNNRIPYQAGDLFVISPEDEHRFEIEESTRYVFIKFTDSYFGGKNHLAPIFFLNTAPEKIMRLKLLKEINLPIDGPGKAILRNTIENILVYSSSIKNLAASPLVYYQLLSIFGLIKEAVSKLNARLDTDHPAKEQITAYIHQHIYNPHFIHVKNIAAHFNISASYFSTYFKRNFQVSYRHYVNHYRTQLIEQRITSGKVSMKQIADEFGFTDGSHLSHYFKQRKSVRPGQWKKAVLSPAPLL